MTPGNSMEKILIKFGVGYGEIKFRNVTILTDLYTI